MSVNELKINRKSEEIQDIVDRMPDKFGLWVSAVILMLISVVLLLGWFISYPDTVTGTITINSKYAPVKLVANISGKMTQLKFHPKDKIDEGAYLAIIQNPANADDIKKLMAVLKTFDVNNADVTGEFYKFPAKLSLGDVNIKYYTFLNTLQLLYNYQKNNIYDKQQENLKNQISGLKAILKNNAGLKSTKENNMRLAKKIADRDSILLAEKVTAEDDADHSRILFLNSKESYQNIESEIRTINQQLGDCENKLQQLLIQKADKEKQMRLDLLSAYDELSDNIKDWELHYVFKSPMSGKVEFAKFWSNNQYVQQGEEVFTILPIQNIIIGQLELPSRGAGKVKVGQEVIIKLNNYPYEEYGSIKGKVSSISLITNEHKVSNQPNIDIYLVEVSLPLGLTTNYGSTLDFKYGLKGSADIIIKKRKLLERLFDNLKYVTDKNN